MPDSNLASERNSGAPQPAQWYMPSSLTFTYAPVNGRSVPCLRSNVVLIGGQTLAPLRVRQLLGVLLGIESL